MEYDVDGMFYWLNIKIGLIWQIKVIYGIIWKNIPIT